MHMSTNSEPPNMLKEQLGEFKDGLSALFGGSAPEPPKSKSDAVAAVMTMSGEAESKKEEKAAAVEDAAPKATTAEAVAAQSC